jgi:hypothetical protein
LRVGWGWGLELEGWILKGRKGVGVGRNLRVGRGFGNLRG